MTMTRRRLVLFCTLLALALPAFASLQAVEPGTRFLKSSVRDRMNGLPVEAMLHVPPGAKDDFPIVVFYHGGTGSRKAYQQLVMNNLVPWSAKYGFVLLSVQNLYALPGNNAQIKGQMYDTFKATLDLLEQVDDLGFDGKVYVTGSSAGGQMAMATVLRRPERFAGIGSFKGNFYSLGVFYNVKGVQGPESSEEDGIFLGTLSSTDQIQSAFDDYFKKLRRRRLTIFYCSGGPTDVPRIKTQQEEARQWYGNYRIPVTIKNYPTEGHGMTEANFADFWKLAEG